MKSINNQKGAIFPLLVVTLLIIGIVVGTKLVDIPQIFKSRASAPVTLPTPVFEDDFSTNTGWEYLGSEDEQWTGGWLSQNEASIGEYLPNEGLIRIMITGQRGFRQIQKRINLTGEFTTMFNFTIRRPSDYFPFGFHFGGPGDSNIYRFYLTPKGDVSLFYGLGNESRVFDSRTTVRFVDDKIYKLRLDRHLNELKAWLSEDNGVNWILMAKAPLDPSAAIGADGAMYMGFVVLGDSVGQNNPEARFDNLKVWRLGQVPEPVEVVVTPTSTPTPSGLPLPSLASLNMNPGNGATISNTSTISVTATVNNGDRFDVWIDWVCFATTSLSGQTYGFTLAEIADRNGKPECKTPGSHTVHVAPIRGAGGVAGRSDGAVYTVRP